MAAQYRPAPAVVNTDTALAAEVPATAYLPGMAGRMRGSILVAALLAGPAVAAAPDAWASPPAPRDPGAYCTRAGCAGATRSAGAHAAGFAASALATLALGRARATRRR